jgi:chaperonin cofactor prefoldin
MLSRFDIDREYGVHRSDKGSYVLFDRVAETLASYQQEIRNLRNQLIGQYDVKIIAEMLSALKDVYPYIADDSIRNKVGNLIVKIEENEK